MLNHPPIYTGPLDEETALIGRNRRIQPRRKSKAENGMIFNRWLIVLTVAALVVLSVRFQNQMNTLVASINDEKQQIAKIVDTLERHEAVIERFNASVTKADVIARLSHLESDLLDTKKDLERELGLVQSDVSQQLNTTVMSLSLTVADAEQKIRDEVEKVKKDVDHYVIETQDQFSLENSFMVYQLAGTFTLLSCLISMWHMTAHLRKMNQPDVQRKILAILWMSPIYAVTSWFSLVFPSAEGYLAIIKDGYEAYIIYQFLSFCIAVIGRGDRDVVVDVLARHADHLTPPFRLFGCFEICGCCVPAPYANNRELADAILLQCQFFAMQFVLLRPLTTTVIVVLGKLKYYGAGDGPSDYRSPQFYVTIIQNLSIFTAFTGLLKFYHAVDKELAWCRPLAKFLCIKGVVFMTFWQGLVISILAETTDVGGKDDEEWARAAQNFLICLEMLLFSIAHFYCFPTDEWQEGYRVKIANGQFGDSIALGDFLSDVKLILTSKKGRRDSTRREPSIRKSKKKKTPAKQPTALDFPVTLVNDHTEEEEVVFVKEKGTGTQKAVEPEKHEQEEDDDDDDDDDDDVEAWEGSDSDAQSSVYDREELDDETFIKKALSKSLGAAGNDPDIAEATQRLLASKVLSPEFFDSTDPVIDIHELLPKDSEDDDEDYESEDGSEDEDDEEEEDDEADEVGLEEDDEEEDDEEEEEEHVGSLDSKVVNQHRVAPQAEEWHEGEKQECNQQHEDEEGDHNQHGTPNPDVVDKLESRFVIAARPETPTRGAEDKTLNEAHAVEEKAEEATPRHIQESNEATPRHIQESNEATPRQIQESNEAKPRHIQKSNEATPSQIQESNEAKPRHIQEPNEAKPRHIQESNEATPRHIQKSNEATPSQIQDPNEAKLRNTQEPNEAKPRQIQESNEAKPRNTQEPNEAKPRQIQEPNEATPHQAEEPREEAENHHQVHQSSDEEEGHHHMYDSEDEDEAHDQLHELDDDDSDTHEESEPESHHDFVDKLVNQFLDDEEDHEEHYEDNIVDRFLLQNRHSTSDYAETDDEYESEHSVEHADPMAVSPNKSWASPAGESAVQTPSKDEERDTIGSPTGISADILGKTKARNGLIFVSKSDEAQTNGPSNGSTSETEDSSHRDEAQSNSGEASRPGHKKRLSENLRPSYFTTLAKIETDDLDGNLRVDITGLDGLQFKAI